MKSNIDKTWNCKCKCVSKFAHRARWAFVSKYKKKYSSKYDNLKILNNETNNCLVKKLLLKKTQSNIKTNQVILVKKVRYDEKKKEIIIEETINNDNLNLDNKANKANKANGKKSVLHKESSVLIEKDLMELKDLLNIK